MFNFLKSNCNIYLELNKICLNLLAVFFFVALLFLSPKVNASYFVDSYTWFPEYCYLNHYSSTECKNIVSNYDLVKRRIKSVDTNYVDKTAVLDFFSISPSFDVSNKLIKHDFFSSYEVKPYVEFDYNSFKKDYNNSLFLCSKSDGCQFLKEINFFWNDDGSAGEVILSDYESCSDNEPIYLRPPSRYIDLSELNDYFVDVPSLNVGFDVDGTLIYVEPAIWKLISTHAADNASDAMKIVCSDGLDYLNIPKNWSLDIIDLHKKRNDKIYFITARHGSDSEVSILKSYLKKIYNFDSESDFEVFFTSGKAFKYKYISELGINTYYGDLDTDIEYSVKAGAQPIRILNALERNSKDCHAFRDPSSRNYCPGVYGEVVLKDSDAILNRDRWNEIAYRFSSKQNE